MRQVIAFVLLLALSGVVHAEDMKRVTVITSDQEKIIEVYINPELVETVRHLRSEVKRLRENQETILMINLEKVMDDVAEIRNRQESHSVLVVNGDEAVGFWESVKDFFTNPIFLVVLIIVLILVVLGKLVHWLFRKSRRT